MKIVFGRFSNSRMIWICDCGTELEFSSIEEEKGFLVSRAVCSECGQEWVLRLTKGRKIKL